MQKVLIIKLGALGDVIMATPLIRQIQAHHQAHDKESRIFLLTSLGFAGLFKDWPWLAVQAFPRQGVKAMLAAMRWIRQQHFSCLYDLQSSDRSGLLCALSGVPQRIGNHPRFPYHLHPKEKYTGQVHAFERMLELLRAGGVAARFEIPDLPVSAEDEATVARWLAQRNLAGRSLALMHAGGSAKHPQKRWPYFAELGEALVAAGYAVLWLGGAADTERNRALAAVCGVDAGNAFSLPGLIALGRRARLAVTNDSGPMHVLSCCRIPVYGLFGRTDWRRSHAVGQRDQVISLDRDQPSFTPTGLEDLSVALVLQRLRQDQLVPVL